MKYIKLALLGVIVCSFVSFTSVVYAQGELFISNATIITGTGEKIENGNIYVKNGKIEAIGANITAPSGVRVVDATGLYAMPGIIDHHSHMAMNSVNEGTSQNTSMTDITDVLRHDDAAIYRAIASGVTTIHQLHGSANVIGGRDEVLKLKWGRTREEMIVPDKMEGVKMALGENPIRRGKQPGSTETRFPNSRMGVEYILRDYFTQAQEYKRAWDEYELKKKGTIKPANDYEKKFGPVPPRKDLRLDTMMRILAGDIRVHTHSYSNHEIAMLLRVTQEFGFAPASLEHVHESYMIADEIAQAGSVVSMFVDFWNYKIEASLGTGFAPALLTEKGVKVAIQSDSAERIRRLHLDAAKTIRYSSGLDETDAIKMVTANPAHGLRLSDRIGTLEKGKDGDIALFDGDPLSIFSKCIKTIIEGEIFFDREKATTTDKWIKGQIEKKITN